MRYRRGATVHRTTRTRHASAENTPDTLMPEADPENWDATRKVAEHGRRYSGLQRSAGAGRDDHRTGLHACNIAETKQRCKLNGSTACTFARRAGSCSGHPVDTIQHLWSG